MSIDKVEERVYVASTPKTKVRLNNNFCRAPMDTGAEINVMTDKVKRKFDLPMRPAPALQWISHTGHRQNFLEVCEEVDVSIGGVTTKQHIFVMNSADHVLVLETPFLIRMRASMAWDSTGDLQMTCYSEDATQMAVTNAMRRRVGTELTENELFPKDNLN